MAKATQRLIEHLRVVRDPSVPEDFFARPASLRGGHHHHPVSVAQTTVTHRGRSVTVKRTYEIFVDGHAIDLPVEVDSHGFVSCHGLPYVSFASATDLVKAVLDEFPAVLPSHHGQGHHTGAQEPEHRQGAPVHCSDRAEHGDDANGRD